MLIKIDPRHPNPSVIKKATELLKQETIIAFPTETVYGVGGLASSKKALLKIYEIKGRSETKPIPIMISNLGMLDDLVRKISKDAKRLMDKFWPGPLTLVLPAKPRLSPILTRGKSTIAVRFPEHPVPKRLMETLGQPLAVTSANLSGQPASVTADGVLEQLQGKIQLLLDGGRCNHGRESTIVDCTGEQIQILREGALSPENIEAVLS